MKKKLTDKWCPVCGKNLQRISKQMKDDAINACKDCRRRK